MGSRLRIFLTLSLLLLGILVVAELVLWQPQHPSMIIDTSANSMMQTSSLNADAILEFRLPGLRLYREITERPLFTKDRRPSNPSQSIVKDTEFPEHLVLQAVYTTAQKRTALLFDQKNKRKLRLSNNQQILGWRVLEIEPWGVILAQGPYQKILHLEKANKVRDD